jgi:hypothetical protein
MAPVAAHAAWQLGDWRAMRQYVEVVAHSQAGGGAEGAFLAAVIAVKDEEHDAAAGAHTHAPPASLGCSFVCVCARV